MKMRAVLFILSVSMACWAGRAQADEARQLPPVRTSALKVTGMGNQPLPKVATPALKVTGMRGYEPPKHQIAQAPPLAGTLGEGAINADRNKYTFSIPVELEGMSDQADSFKVAVAVQFSGAGLRSIANETERPINAGHFDGTVYVSVQPATGFSGTGLSYKAYLTICSTGACVSPVDPSVPAWARPQPSSSPKVSHEAPLTSQTDVEVPTLSMTGNKTDDRIMQGSPAKNADSGGSFSQGSDLSEVDSGKGSLKHK